MMNFGKFFKRKIGFSALTSLAILSSLFYPAAVSAMDPAEGDKVCVPPVRKQPDQEDLASSSAGQVELPKQDVDEPKGSEAFDHFAGETSVKCAFVKSN